MARPAKSELRSSIRFRRVELILEHPLTAATKINQMLAEEFNVSVQTIWYHLRVDSSDDKRTKYTQQERDKCCSMTRKQLLLYATQNGLNFNTLYAMVWREKSKGFSNKMRTEDYVEVCERRNFMDFGRLADLKAFHHPRDAYKEAKKAVQSVQSMDLLAPNFLVHPPSRKYYILSLSEQRFLLANPRRFLRENAQRISENWKSYDDRDSYFVLLDARFADSHHEGKTLSVHSTFENAAHAASAKAHSENPVPTKIIRRYGSAKGAACVRYEVGEYVPKRGLDAAPLSPSQTIEFIPDTKAVTPGTQPAISSTAIDHALDSYDENLAELTPEEWEEEDRMTAGIKRQNNL